MTMEVPYILISTICPENGKKIDEFDKHSKYIVKVSAPTDLAMTLFDYAENFFEAAHTITEFILYAEHPDIGKLDTYFFAIAFLYRHCMEVGLKAIGFQYIQDVEDRKRFVKDTRHNLSEILNVIGNKSDSIRPNEEVEWLKKYFDDLSKMDRESDSFRYPFHIVWELDEWELEGKFVIKNSEGKYEIVDSFSYGFDNPAEELAFCADCYNHPETAHSTHNEYLNIANGVAEVSRTGAWMAFKNLDWDNKTYVLEYDIDLSDLQEGAFVAFDSGEMASWQDIHLGFKKDSDGITAYKTLFNPPDDSQKLGTIGNRVHATYTYSYSSDNGLSMKMVISDSANTYTVEKSVPDFNTADPKANLCWDVYTADGESDIYAKLDNFTFKSLA